ARGAGLGAIALTIFIHVMVAVSVLVLSRSLGLGATLVDCVALVPPVLLLMTLPISIAGWGVREGSMVVAFGLIGVEATDALALSLLFGAACTVVGLAGGVVWLLSGRTLRSGARGDTSLGALERSPVPGAPPAAEG
ncbi:MAG: lysylphosphatidylglycerol synthase domain-containing protein, partial [Alphaproteobacteria bacterium]